MSENVIKLPVAVREDRGLLLDADGHILAFTRQTNWIAEIDTAHLAEIRDCLNSRDALVAENRKLREAAAFTLACFETMQEYEQWRTIGRPSCRKELESALQPAPKEGK